MKTLVEAIEIDADVDFVSHKHYYHFTSYNNENSQKEYFLNRVPCTEKYFYSKPDFTVQTGSFENKVFQLFPELNPLWLKLFKMSFIRKYRLYFHEDRKFEDHPFCYIAFLLAKKTSIINNPQLIAYFYRQRSDSILHSKNTNKHALDPFLNLKDYLNDDFLKKQLEKINAQDIKLAILIGLSADIQFFHRINIFTRITSLNISRILKSFKVDRERFREIEDMDIPQTHVLFNLYKYIFRRKILAYRYILFYLKEIYSGIFHKNSVYNDIKDFCYCEFKFEIQDLLSLNKDSLIKTEIFVDPKQKELNNIF